MKDKRQGNDLKVAWSIFMQDGEPFRLDGKDVSLYLKNMFGRKELNDFVTSGNIIQWTFYGKDQKNTGKYSLELVINEGEKGMITTDKCDFVNLVSCSCKLQGGDDAPNVETESIELTSTLEYVAGGGEYDDTALWNELDNKVDKEEGLGLSEENYTTEEKEKLAGLENYDDSVIKEDLAKKAEKSEIPTKMSQLEQDIEIGATPDWSASEGEAGFIKNRTHYPCGNPREENTYEERGLAWRDIREINPFGYNYYKVTINGESHIIDFVGKDWPQYDFEKDEQNKFEYDLEFDNNVGLKLSFFKNGGGESIIVIEYYPTYSNAPETIDVSITDYYVDFKQLDEKFIPDTIARKSELTELNESFSELQHNFGEVDSQAASALDISLKNEDKLTELSEEVSGLSERIDNLPSGESSVFEAVYKETTYEEIVEAHNSGKTVIFKDGSFIYPLVAIDASAAFFELTFATTGYRTVCQKSGSWYFATFPFEHKLETLENGNAKITIAGKTAEVATPQYVENLLGVIINGDY